MGGRLNSVHNISLAHNTIRLPFALCVDCVFFSFFGFVFFCCCFDSNNIQTMWHRLAIFCVCVLFAIRNWCASECDCVLWRTLLPGLLIVFNIGYGFC